MMRVSEIVQVMEKLAPRQLAAEWDNVGLQVGHPESEVRRILVALDASEAAIARAEEAGCQLLIVHHPLIFKPQAHWREDSPLGRKLARLVRAGLAVYVAHTNLDVAAGGVNDVLAERLELMETRVLAPAGEEGYYKLVVFVPEGYEDRVWDALAGAGAGWIGKYSHCSFQTLGTGTFKPLEGANPFLGQVGTLEYAKEYRLETILPRGLAADVIRAMLQAHPYEEVAYDLYPLANPGRSYGLGRVGRLPVPVPLADFAQRVSQVLGAPVVRWLGDPSRRIERVAVLGGSGQDFIDQALSAGADVLVTGDVGYHRAREAWEKGLAVIDAGHWATEAPVVPALAARLRQFLAEKGAALEVLTWTGQEDPFRAIPGHAVPENGPPAEGGSPAKNDQLTGKDLPGEGRALLSDSRLPDSRLQRSQSGGLTRTADLPLKTGQPVDLILRTDGASRGNPGPAGIGVVIEDEGGAVLQEISEVIGETTNNVAEYRALLRGLAAARAMGARRIKVFSDSELMVRQMNGSYRVNNQGLLPLFEEARDLIRGFESFSIHYVPREKNARADQLANQALDAAR